MTLCDSCPQESKYEVVFQAGRLYFCRHHFERHKNALLEMADRVVSLRPKP